MDNSSTPLTYIGISVTSRTLVDELNNLRFELLDKAVIMSYHYKPDAADLAMAIYHRLGELIEAPTDDASQNRSPRFSNHFPHSINT